MIVELGAAWPAAHAVGVSAGCRGIAETEGEGPLGFAARVDDFVAQAFPRAVSVTRALVACNQRADQAAEAARRAVAEALLGRLAGTGSLFFHAPQAASERFRRRLLDLVAELSAVAGRANRIQARLDDEGGRDSGPRASERAPQRVGNDVARVA